MHDIRAIRANAAAFDAALARRGLPSASAEILARDSERRAAQTALQEKQTRKNEISKAFGVLKRQGLPTSSLTLELAQITLGMNELEERTGTLDREITGILENLPNMLDPDVPDGLEESDSVVLATYGEPRDLGFQPKPHWDLGEALGMMDFATAAKMAGARSTILRGPLARLERALGQFMLDLHTGQHGYEEMVVPSLVNDAAAYGTDKLPKFADDLFRTTDGRWLIPTAEVSLTATVMGEMLAEKDLPIRITALTDCFRSEAGAAGRDTRGMLRQHQFRKVELVSITHPDQSAEEHERMTSCAETVLRLLGVPFRRIVLSAGDTGFGAVKTYDLEVWMPGQQAWREISSCSNTRDFQARRMNARFRSADGKTVAYVNTLNGSGVAVGRALIAVMENYQQADGSILIPEAVRAYMGGLERIAAQA
jgi:seryl-tRNA synthetase